MHKILIVDDDAAYRRVCTQVLQRAGYEILSAADGSEALRLLETTGVDAVLTDILMPEKEGIETIMALRKRWPEIRILAMSGGGSVAAEHCLAISGKLGVVATLRKPFTAAELVQTMNGALQVTTP